MIQNRRQQVKQTALTLNGGNKSTGRIFSHRKTPSQNLLQKKPQILLMKWSDFIEKFHILKQLHSINHSLNIVNTHLKVKKQELTIIDVPYIQSEQVSINQRDEQAYIVMQQSRIIDFERANVGESNISNIIKGTSRTTSSIKMINQNSIQLVESENSNKIVISVQINQEIQSIQNKVSKKNQSEDYQNFTDEEQNEKSNKTDNSIENYAIKRKLHFIQNSSKKQQQEQSIQSYYVNQSLRDTAHFSFNGHHSKSKSPGLKYQSKDNQQNVNNLNNCQLSKKVQVLIKLQKQQQVRRQKAQKIMKQDQQYLSKFLKKK